MYHGKVTPLGRRPTGAKIKKTREKKKRELGGYPAETQIGERRVRIKRTKGGGFKLAVLKDGYANISKPDGSTIKSKILDVVENKADRSYKRRKIMTRGAIIRTDAGLARITSRPGQDGVINAVLIGEKES